MIITKPMLASTLKINDLNKLKFPLLVTYKLDGIRAIRLETGVVTRKFKPIPNKFIRAELEKLLPAGCDCEIISGSNFQECTSSIMSFEGEPKFTCYVFDYVKDVLSKPYKDRIEDLKNLNLTDNRIVRLYPQQINSLAELLEFENKAIELGYEGIMLRKPDGEYKCGRSTPKQEWLMKLKRFSDSEGTIIGFEAKTINTNEAKINELGYTERSTAKDGLKEINTLGTILAADPKFPNYILRIGSGLDDKLRQQIWNNKKEYLGKLVKYKYFDYNIKTGPRFPIWLGIRSNDDMD